jgi:hypothetical protein
MTDRPIEAQREIPALANVSDARSAARALCAWAKGKPEDTRNQVLMTCLQLRMLARGDDPKIRRSVAGSIKLLTGRG